MVVVRFIQTNMTMNAHLMSTSCLLQVLDAFHHGSVEGYPSVKAIIAESKQLQEFQELFEMYVSDYVVLTRCSEELLHLKGLWDMVSGHISVHRLCCARASLCRGGISCWHIWLVRLQNVHVNKSLLVAVLAGCRWAW